MEVNIRSYVLHSSKHLTINVNNKDEVQFLNCQHESSVEYESSLIPFHKE
jgi:hypothetical protein